MPPFIEENWKGTTRLDHQTFNVDLERKYEVDSLLSFAVGLSSLKETETSQFDETLSQRLRKFFICGRWNQIIRNSLIVLSEIRTVRKITGK